MGDPASKDGHQSCKDGHQHVEKRKPREELVFCSMVALPANTA